MYLENLEPNKLKFLFHISITLIIYFLYSLNKGIKE